MSVKESDSAPEETPGLEGREEGVPTEAEGGQAAREPKESDAGADLSELEDRLLRMAAEFENYKKRRARELQELLRFRSEPLVRDILPVLDALERAIRSSEGTRDYQAFHDGVELILQQMRDVLARHAVERDHPEGEPFDPHRHEAVAMVPSEGVAPDHVIEVVEPGYHLHERVVRPARVVVSAGTGEKADEGGAEDEAEGH
jgi:molecular chaperone GrpE